jgi:hypothetical protein
MQCCPAGIEAKKRLSVCVASGTRLLIQDRILALIAERPMSAADIRAALADAKLRTIASAIHRLRDRGQIEVVGWGVYSSFALG